MPTELYLWKGIIQVTAVVFAHNLSMTVHHRFHIRNEKVDHDVKAIDWELFVYFVGNQQN